MSLAFPIRTPPPPATIPLHIAQAVKVLIMGALLYWAGQRLNRMREEDELTYTLMPTEDAFLRQPVYKNLSNQELARLHQMLDLAERIEPSARYGVRDPLTGVTVRREALQEEYRRRFGLGGFLMVPTNIGFIDDRGSPSALPETIARAGLVAWAVGGAAVGGLARLAAQLWGLMNRPAGLVTPSEWPSAITYEYLWATSGTLIIQGTWEESYQFEFRNPPGLPSGESGSGTWGPISIPDVDGLRLVYNPGTPVGQWQPAGTGGGTESNTLLYRQNGVWVGAINTGSTAGGGIGPSPSEWRWTGYARTVPTVINHYGQPVYPPPVPAQSPYPGRSPFGVATPAELPATPGSQPNTVRGSETNGEPVVQPSTPGVTPATIPATAPIAAPALPRVPLIPGAVPTTDQGTLPVPRPGTTPTTQPVTIVPWPNATPINPVPLAPPATLSGIALKTGELEGKLDQIGRMLQPEPGGGDYTDLLQLVGPILSFLTSADPAGGYEISSPCETGEGSPSEPLVAAWGPSIGADAQVIKRIDALAELLQHHKNLKQPSCKNPSPVGEVVTVQFEET